jgi:glucokinase
MTTGPVLACDLGGTRLRVARVEADGAVRDKQVIPTPPDDPGALSRLLRRALDTSKDFVGIVIGVPGPIDYEGGTPLRLPNLPGWEGHVSARGLSEELDIAVLLANDADLAALGEHRYGAGQGSRDMAYVTTSTGVGAGVIIDGRLLHGRLSLAEIGHTIIDRATGDTVEYLGSGTALARLAGEDPGSVAARAAAGEPDAVRLFAGVAGDLAIGVFNLVHCFTPDTVVIGGGMSQAGELILGPVRAALTRCADGCPASRVKVVRAQGGDDAGLRGAAAYWAETRSAPNSA